MSMELCGDCLKLFDSDMSIEAPVNLLVPPLVQPEKRSCVPLAADTLVVWRCPACSLEGRASA